MATPARPAARGVPEVGTVGTPGSWIITGLIVAWLGGILGSLLYDSGEDGATIFFSVSAIAGIPAGMLLAVRHIRGGLDLSGAGFALFAMIGVASAVLGFTGTGAEAVFASIALLHLPAFLLIASQAWGPIWGRAAVALSGLVFAIYGYDYLLGDDRADPDSPLVVIGYLLLLVAILGWIMTLRAEGEGGWIGRLTASKPTTMTDR